jgi:hypothetical protein
MAERLFLYIDILGFKNLVESGYDVMSIFEDVNRLNVHSDQDFGCIVFSDTILVHAKQMWNMVPNQGIMWLTEFAQDFFYRLISKDVHMRAYITFGDFHHEKLSNLDAYYGEALIRCYEREKRIKSTGVFIDARLVPYCDIFKTSRYDDDSHYVHVMQHLDDISASYDAYPISGEYLAATGMEWWVAYLLKYMENTYRHSIDANLSEEVRFKHASAWRMISDRHEGLAQALVEADFDFGRVVELDWSEPLRRIGTAEGAWG